MSFVRFSQGGPLRRAPFVAALVGLTALFAACANTDVVGCRVGADCVSGVCNADGTCATSSTGGSGTGGTTGTTDTNTAGGGTSTGGSGGTGTGGTGGSGASGSCLPNNDGTITAKEAPFAAGLSAKYKVAEGATFDTTGAKQADGTRIWDFTTALPGDQSVIVETIAPDGTWWAADFAGATYASRLSQSADLLGVFEVTADELLLRGVVSPTDGFTSTKLTYDPPVTVLAFPMKKGDTWSTTSTVSGTASGVVSYYYESYKSEVDAAGVAKTPYAEFPVLRVATDLTRTYGALITTTRTFAFPAECFGPVATVVSNTNELGDEFTSTAEVRRLSP